MSFWYSFWVWIFRFLAIGGLMVFLVIMYMKYKKTPEIDKRSIILNQNSEYTNGHGIGWGYGKIEQCRNGVWRAKFVPLDMTKEEREENKIVIETILSDDIHVASKGKISGTVDIVTVKPSSLSKVLMQCPHFSYNTSDGKVIDTTDLEKYEFINKTTQRNFGLSFDVLQNLTRELMHQKWRGGEISASEIAKLTDVNKSFPQQQQYQQYPTQQQQIQQQRRM